MSNTMRTLTLLWLGVPPFLGVFLAGFAISQWWNASSVFGGPPYLTPEHEVRRHLSLVMTIALALAIVWCLAALNMWKPGDRTVRARSCWRYVLIPLCFSPSLINLLLYAEDPYDGAGFPGSTVIGAALCALLSTVFFVWPAYCMANSLKPPIDRP